MDTGKQAILSILGTVTDPEIPVLTVLDLGIVREVQVTHLPSGEQSVEVTITPTYSGCPAMDVIAMSIRMALIKTGYKKIKITQQLSPAWTTDWMTEIGRQKLKAYGIAPPVGKSFDEQFLSEQKVSCPLCHSQNTKLLSQFGSTACKALFQCNDCLEPFEYFKCH